MKQKDVALILVIVFISGIMSYLISNKFISSPKHDLKVAKIEHIDSTFEDPDKAYFNDKSINFTQLIFVYKNDNKQPFTK